MTHKTIKSALITGMLTVAAPSIGVASPLTVEGRETVYQRVLTRSDAALYAVPGGDEITTFAPFDPLYVFARQGDWLAVGRSSSGEAQGWVMTDAVVDWRQNIVAVFTNPANRHRQIMFDTLPALQDYMQDEAILDLQPNWVSRIDAGDVPPDVGIVGVEPENHIDIQSNFYVMPILEFIEDRHPLSFEQNILMEVASIPAAEPQGRIGQPSNYDVGIVFVIDTTSSMDVHFPVVQAQVASVVSRIEGTEVGDRVNFGIIAFRDDNTGRFADLGYRVSEILPLERRQSQQIVVQALADLEDANLSSPGVSEDSFTAVSYALQDVDWSGGGSPFGGKYVVLVTDAAPKLPGQAGATDSRDTYSFTASDLQATAEALGIAVMTIHLKTDVSGEANHALGERQYRALSTFAGNEFYYPIAGGDPAIFAERSQQLITFFKDDVLAADGEDTDLTDEEAGEALVQIRNEMVLRYLGRQEGTTAPDIVRSWVTRLNADDPRYEAMSFRLLVTRDELATMAELIGEFYDIGNNFQSEEDIENFHGSIREAIVRISQNPERVVNPSAERSGDALEFLDDLPYRSQLLRMSIDFFVENPSQRRVILDGLNSKRRSYQRWLTTPDVWQPLYDDAPDGEWVTTLPIEFLP